MIRTLGLQLTGLASLLLVLVLPGVAGATVMLPLGVEALARESDWVVRGTVRESVAAFRTVSGRRGIYTEVTVEVDEWLLGAGERTVRFLVHGGRVGHQASVVHGQARFEEGESVVVFLYRAGAATWLTGMSQGKWLLRESGRVVSTRDPSALLATGRAGVPSTSPSMMLPELRRRVRLGARP